MGEGKKISDAVIQRLPRYYRYLGSLMRHGIEKISSKELAGRMGLTASQIRQDLNYFGGFGQQGYGYNLEFLRKEIGDILGIDQKYPTIILGAGHLGHALANNMNFDFCGFKLIGIFDNDPKIVGQKIKDITVMHISELDEFCEKYKPKAAVLTLPREVTVRMAEKLLALGIKGFWNFSNGELKLSNPKVPVENVHLADKLMILSYRMENVADN
jgi:redox-sensing transcriptional repressor